MNKISTQVNSWKSIWALSEMTSQNKNGHCSVRTFVWATMGRKFWNDHISAKKDRYGYWKNANLALLWKPPEIHLCAFIVLSCNHTCGLELDIFFLGWDMIAIKFSSHSRHTNFVTTAAIFIFWCNFSTSAIVILMSYVISITWIPVVVGLHN